MRIPYAGLPIIVLHCILSLPLHAQYVVRQWTIEHGLPQSSVRCITQTHDGYLWVGTWNGLARFDGVSMTVFNALNTPDFHPSIVDICEDSRRRLWIGTDGGGLVQFREGRLVRLDSADGITATIINSIGEDREGRVWFGTEKGLYVLTGQRFVYPAGQGVFPEEAVTQIVPSPDGSMYLAVYSTIYHVRLSGDSLVFLDKPLHSGGYRIDIDSSGALWYGVRGKGLVKRIGAREYVDRRFANLHLKEVYIPANQQKWIMTPHGGHVLEGRESVHIQTIDGIDLSNINFAFEDREGIMWVAAEGAGLLRLRRRQVGTVTKREGLITNEIMTGLEDREGNLWIGTWTGGLVRRNAGAQRFTPVPPLANGITVMALCQSRDGRIWVGTWAEGVHTIEKGRVRKFMGKGLEESTSIREIVEDPRGGVWIATVYGTVGYYNGKEEKSWDADEGIPGMINSMLLTRGGEIWVGTDGGGIARISDGRVSVLKKADGIIDDFFHVGIEDTDGAIWLTSKRGLQRWKNGVLSAGLMKYGFQDDAAQFIQDNAGNYWIGGTHGIHRIRQRDLNEAADGTLATALSFLTVGKADGMPVEECSGGSNELRWKMRDGSLWFSTTHGAIRVDPHAVASNPVPPGVILDQVLVEHKPVENISNIVLKPEQTKVEFHYTGINFASPERIRFQYKLEGFDGEWHNAGYERFAQYTNLRPGAYVFRVKAANNAGIWNEEGASVAIEVLPSFWETWWFRGLAVIFFLTVGPVIYWYRVRQLNREKEQQMEFSRRLLRSQEEERQRIANELHDSLGQNLLVLKNRMLVAQQGNEQKNGLGEMSELVSQTIEEVRSISHNLRPHQLDQLGVSKTIRALVKNVGESSSIAFTADVEDIDSLLQGDEDIGLFRIIQESLNNIIKHSDAHHARVSVKKNAEAIEVTISDDGRGMDVISEQTKEEIGMGFGMSGLRERAKMFGWELVVRSQPNQGTTISLLIMNAQTQKL